MQQRERERASEFIRNDTRADSDEGAEGAGKARVGRVNARRAANTLWAHVIMGRDPGEGLMRELEGQAEALHAQGVGGGN